MKRKPHFNFSFLLFTFSFFLVSTCSVQKQIAKNAQTNILSKAEVQTAHVGIAVYDVAEKKFLYQHNSNKYFIPASNTKLFTCYAAMKYLGDSLPGINLLEDANNVYLFPTGDPSLLMEDFSNHPVANRIQQFKKPIFVIDTAWKDNGLGFGWSWDDYEADYMAERSALPVQGNLVSFSGSLSKYYVSPFLSSSNFEAGPGKEYISAVKRERNTNHFLIFFEGKKNDTIHVPFTTENGKANVALLAAALYKKISIADSAMLHHLPSGKAVTIYSQPTDSLLSIMMHRSDNFFAEQSLLMVSNKLFGVMNDHLITDTLLKTDYKDLPQHPKWVDGSGLSRYNLFSPEDFVFLLKKMREDFNWNRITAILPTGGTGTISSYYKNLKGRIFAKTGTLSNNVALSGYLITKKNKTLIFSVLVNNHISSVNDIRKDIEAFLTKIAD